MFVFHSICDIFQNQNPKIYIRVYNKFQNKIPKNPYPKPRHRYHFKTLGIEPRHFKILKSIEASLNPMIFKDAYMTSQK